jgi:dTDP-4-amino-4,6-dideoxygalactose transaminase
VHVQPAYRRFLRDDLPVTEDITGHALSLPFFHDMSDEYIVAVVDRLENALAGPM